MSSNDITTWKKILIQAMAENKECLANIIDSTFEGEEWNKEFDAGYGAPNGDPFTVWTNDYVYFPTVYDGAEWIGSVRRNPCGVKTEHIGSW